MKSSKDHVASHFTELFCPNKRATFFEDLLPYISGRSVKLSTHIQPVPK